MTPHVLFSVFSLNHIKNQQATDPIACELDSWVVLYLPKAFVESFPLVRLRKFVFILLVEQKILWAQECTKGEEERLDSNTNDTFCVSLGI